MKCCDFAGFLWVYVHSKCLCGFCVVQAWCVCLSLLFCSCNLDGERSLAEADRLRSSVGGGGGGGGWKLGSSYRYGQ